MDVVYSIADLLAAVPPREPRIPLWAMELAANVFLYAWLFCVGACVGSFLNVVVYRLPRGKNLAHPGSFCPRCRRPIRLWDNIPLVSWLVLRGRCRDCREPIPARYFFVELAVATLFLAVALIETKLPGEISGPFVPLRLLTPFDTLPFWSAYTLDVVLLTTLLGAALIDASGQITPWKLFVPATALALALSVIWTQLAPLGWLETSNVGLLNFAHALAGTLFGLGLGSLPPLVWRFWAGYGEWPKFAPAAMLGTVGAAVGIDWVVEIALIALPTFVAFLAWIAWRRSTAIVPFAAIVAVLSFPRVVELDLRLTGGFWLPTNSLIVGPLAMLAFVVCAQIAPLIAPRQYFAPPPNDPPEVALTSAEPESSSEDETLSMAPTAGAVEPPLENAADKSVPSLREPAP